MAQDGIDEKLLLEVSWCLVNISATSNDDVISFMLNKELI